MARVAVAAVVTCGSGANESAVTLTAVLPWIMVGRLGMRLQVTGRLLVTRGATVVVERQVAREAVRGFRAGPRAHVRFRDHVAVAALARIGFVARGAVLSIDHRREPVTAQAPEVVVVLGRHVLVAGDAGRFRMAQACSDPPWPCCARGSRRRASSASCDGGSPGPTSR